MGNCCCQESHPVTDFKPLQDEECRVETAFKFPHGTSGICTHKDNFIPCDVNEWISQLYKNTAWTGWLIYNDELPKGYDVSIHKGHCKGILTWNETHVGWLVHSVPRFPSHFTGVSVSIIEPSELLYGQSFVYVERRTDLAFLKKVIAQIFHMNATIYMKCNEIIVPQLCHNEISRLTFSNKVIHLAKPPAYHIDIHEELCKYSNEWFVETWKRGHPLPPSTHAIHDITSVCLQHTTFRESQDHSKWGVSVHYYWVGDLNRMETQLKRGGGGFLVHDLHVIDVLQRAKTV